MLDDLRSALQRLDRQELNKRQGPQRTTPEPRPGSNDATQSET
jgi:hypothetical protein